MQSLRLSFSLCFLLLFLAVSVRGQDVAYSGVDRATVRVLALARPRIINIEHERSTYQIGVPVGGHGSGVLLTEDGLVLTAAHVVHNARILAVHLPGARAAVPAKVVYVNDAEDYAFVRISGSFRDVGQLAPADNPLKVRQTIFAVGYPLDINRSDAQSSRGAISGKLKDGRLQLDISVNHGNSGGPVIDENELVQGIVVTRSDVEQGAVGLATAVPSSVFRQKFEELAAAGPGDLDDITSTQATSLANIVSMLAEDGPEWFKGSIESSDSQNDMNFRVNKMTKEMPTSADAQLLASVYFWNRYMVRLAEGKETENLHQRAVAYSEKATKLEPDLKESSEFVEYVLGEGKTERAPRRSGSRPRHHEGLFLRGGYGIGYASFSATTSAAELSLSGVTKEWQLLIGGGFSGVTYGALFAGSSGDLTYNLTRLDVVPPEPTQEGSADLSLFRYGAFMQYYPWITRGLHFQGQFGLFALSSDVANSSGSSSGLDASLGVGYEFWFADHWSIGLIATGTYLFADDDSGSEGALLPTLSAELTWN